jgi:hypothetical protein
MLESNPGLLRLRHWQSDALTYRLISSKWLDLVHIWYIIFVFRGTSIYFFTHSIRIFDYFSVLEQIEKLIVGCQVNLLDDQLS